MDATEKYGFGLTPFQAEGGLSFGRTESGFDTLTVRYYGSTSEPRTYSDLHWPTGSIVSGYSNMYVASVDCQQEGDDVYAFTVNAKGLLGLQGVKRDVSTKLQSYTTGPVTIPGGGAVTQAQGQYMNLSCTFKYVSLFPPNYSTRPQDALPPSGMTLPSPPPNPFTTLPTTPIYNYPWGWLRQGFNEDKMVGAEVYFLTEEWEYKYEYLPG